MRFLDGEHLRLFDGLCSGDYSQPSRELVPGQSALFNRFFRFTDGIRDPLSLILPDDPSQSQNFDFTLCIDGECLNFERLCNHYQEAVFTAMTMSWNMRRTLDDPDEPQTYLRLQDVTTSRDDFLRFLDAEAGRTGNRLALMDAGCGQANAFRSLFTFDSIDPGCSVGLTLPHIGLDLAAFSDLPVVIGNIINCGRRQVFDVVLDICGAFTNHPTQDFNQRYRNLFGLLHALSFVRPGGVFIAGVTEWHDALSLLERIGLVEVIHPLQHPTYRLKRLLVVEDLEKIW